MTDPIKDPPDLFDQLFAWLRRERPWTWLSGVLHTPTIIAAAVAGLVFYQLGMVSLPFAPFVTRGEIHVDSPEVYTRERLVNDRYEQDHWLRTQLARLDKTSNLLTGTVYQRVGVGVGARPSQAPPPPPPSAAGGADGVLPFDQEFRIRSAVRDSIRQLILENMLDDRHDLTGNSVYGLKFDTALIPGTNTHQRAFVRVKAIAEPPMNRTREREWIRSGRRVPYEIWSYYHEGSDFYRRTDSDLYKPYHLYEKWLRSVQNRLNDHVAALYQDGFAQRRCDPRDPDATFDLATRRAIELVLGIDEDRYRLPKGASKGFGTPINLPQPWSTILGVQRKAAFGDGCEARPWFEVAKVIDSIYLFDGEELPEWARNRMFRYTVIDMETGKRALAVLGDQSKLLFGSMEDYYALTPKFPLDREIIAEAEASDRVVRDEMCLEYGADGCVEGKAMPVKYTVVPSGLFNFIAKIKQIDAYAYAVFPKNDAVGILADTSQEVAASASEGVGGWAAFLRGMRETQTKSVLVGFSGGASGEGEVQFGWVITGRGIQQPVQKAQMSLVSVPAWTTNLKLEITRGWLGRNSEELDPVRVTHTVAPLPTDYEALDTIMFKGSEGRRPKILNDFMEREGQTLVVAACQPARILIPGSRLWRSAEVTLDAQMADKITVLPNMEGIIAEFGQVEIPNPLPEPDRTGLGLIVSIGGSPIEVPLRVWTSEGMDVARKFVRIRLPRDGATRCARRPAAAHVPVPVPTPVSPPAPVAPALADGAGDGG